GVGLVLVPLNRLTDEHEDLYSRDPVATFSSLFTSSGKVALVESIAYRRHYPDFPYFWQAPRRSWANRAAPRSGAVRLRPVGRRAHDAMPSDDQARRTPRPQR